MSYARRVAYNTIVQIIGRVLTTVTSLTTVSILNATLKPAGWGAYVVTTTYLGFFAVVADMGLNLLYLREISRFPEKEQDITSRYLGFRLITAALVLLVFAPLIGAAVPVYRPFLVPIVLLGVGQFALTINQMCVTVVQARLLMDRAMISDLLGRIVILGGTAFALTRLPEANRLVGAVAIVVGGNLINLLVSYLFVRKFVRFRPRFVFSEWPAIFVQVLPLGAMAVLGMIHFKADSVLLTIYKSNVDVGIYGNAYKVLEILLTLPALFVGGLFPEMNQLIQKGHEGFRVLMQKAFDLIIFAVVPVVTGIVLIAPQLIAILTRSYITESARSLQILAFAMIPLFVGVLMSYSLLAAEKQKALGFLELFAAAVNISLNLYLIPRYSYYGAGTATVASELLTTAITIWMVARTIGFFPKLRTFAPTLVGAAIMFGLFRLVQHVAGSTWDGSYYDWSRPHQAALLLGVVIIGVLGYLIPFVLFRQFPPVLQERLSAKFKRSE